MNDHFQYIEEIIKKYIYVLYKLDSRTELDFQYTKKEHKGDLTLVLFSLSKKLNKSVEEIGNNIGNCVQKELKGLVFFSIVGGFLNFIFEDKYYGLLLRKMLSLDFFHERSKKTSKKIIIEFSSPNANKPLHLGHMRNSLIGNSLSEILKTLGNKIIKVQIINDRGIHICKSMIAWLKFGKGKTPYSEKEKGDHFVGKYYNLFDKIYNEEMNKNTKVYKKIQVPSILNQARILLKNWEEGDYETRNVWRIMNKWVYSGFDETYQKLGITFDKIEYESNIYEIGKKIIIEGLKKGIFFKKKDGSICVDLIKEGFDEKILLRSDQTSVYITQDIGTAVERFKRYNMDKLIYIVGREQDYHFQVLFIILKRLGYTWVDKLLHLSYEMVYLPSGIMRSREGKVINADSIISKMFSIAKNNFSEKYSKSKEEINKSSEIIALGALKFLFLKIDPNKKIVFHPEKSIDFKGKTGTYIQYTYSRIRSLEKKFFELCSLVNYCWSNVKFDIYQKNMIKIIQKYPLVLKKSANHLNPSLIANYVYEVAKTFNHLYQKKKLIDPMNLFYSNMSMNIIHVTGNILKFCMNLLGIKMLDRM
ncbi:arginine--tRNA ligase [Blattabacterium cuenoti]|uniref:arginine--tRNA ligase n=1 Tax=Blattabacterium cuenoti TaxID=1653831 RepID=UPI00163C672F|nr:arginine--tRNA ligase [Blattabacterium cuenoti]